MARAIGRLLDAADPVGTLGLPGMPLSHRAKTIGFLAAATAVAAVAVAFDAEGLRKERRMRDQAVQLHAENERLAAEIGRASCRERVCSVV